MSDTLSAVSLLVRSLSDEVEARFEKSFAQRDAELVRLRADVIALKDEAALTLATAKKYLEDFKKAPDGLDRVITERLKWFVESIEFKEAISKYFTDNWTSAQCVDDLWLCGMIRTILRDLLQRATLQTEFVIDLK